MAVRAQFENSNEYVFPFSFFPSFEAFWGFFYAANGGLVRLD